jgi:prepilin-type N-terminal cleavage/methylation domain-containing protein
VRRSQGGFTLIELMVSMVICSVLVLLLMSVFGRMSLAYRHQQAAVRVQQTLAAARTAIEHDAREAGLLVSQGFTISADLGANRYSPVRVTNRANGPDEVAFFYADPSSQAVVLGLPSPTAVTLTVDDSAGFAAGDLVVLSTPDTRTLANPISSDDANIAAFTACVLRIAVIDDDVVTFENAGAWGNATNAHCASPVGGSTMLYKFVAHAWRVDTSRPDVAALQLDTTGGLVEGGTFTDQAYGVVDLQAATYFYDADGNDTQDPDADGDRDWASSDTQETLTDPVPVASPFVPPLMMALSLVARTSSNVEGVTTARSPMLGDPANLQNNTLGDRPSFTLPSATDPMFAGNHIYRFVTFQVDFRNMGVGR